ncbi:MAG: DUF1460 domain-containing protein [Alphaproteobacteria bacterium]|nr:DUF1460 domain-containing protein [Alphaproteobacteria bacterium]
MWRAVLIAFLFGCACGGNATDLAAEYIGVKYVLDPLGEAHAPDIDPLIRFDAFDCTTFVETVLADGDVQRLNKIRYADGVPNFTNRNHFIETDWLSNNSDIVQNVSNRYGKTATHTVTIDKKNWFRTVHNMDTDFSPETVALRYIPYKYAADIKVEKPVVVLFLRNNTKIRDKIGTDLAVRHMGFLLPNGTLRHASRRAGAVVDEDFTKYVQRMMEKQNNLGIMILEIKK